jgi:type I restriction enzyme S subunit
MRETSVPTGWSVKTLGDLGQVKVGLTYKPENVSEFGTLVLRSSNIQNDRLAFHDNVFVDIPVGEGATVHAGDLLICVRNGSRRLIGKTAMIDQNAHGMAFGAFMSAFRSDLNPYLIWLFQSQIIQEQIEENLGATINQITNATLKRFKIPLPDDPQEQEAIAEALSDADALIEGLERLIAKKRLIKQGAMQDLLTAKCRLPEFSGEWVETTVAGCARISRIGCNPIGEPEQVFEHYSLPAFDAGPAPAFEKGKEIQSNKFRVPEGALLVSKLNPRIPRIWAPSITSGHAVCSTEFVVLIPSENVEREFLKQVFLSPHMTDEMTYRATGTTGSHQRIAPTTFAALRISLPAQEEQQVIAAVLGDMDAEIQALDTRLEKARQVKEGMMQNLLTGRIRLV